MSRFFGLPFCLVILCWAVCRPAHGQETHVVPDDFETIQEAIEAAEDGDTIEVLAGIYEENLDALGKSFALIACDGPELTSIWGLGETLGPDLRSVLHLGGGDNVLVDGFTITLGFGTAVTNGAGTFHNGGGVYAKDATIEIVNCTIHDNFNGGIHVRDASVTIRDSTIIGNEGGGILSSGLSFVTLDNSAILENTSDTIVGGIVVHPGGSSWIEDTTISDNDGLLAGGALLVGPATMLRTEISNNTAFFAGGLAVDGSTVTVQQCVISGNSATSGGGLLLCSPEELLIEDTLIVGNEGVFGGAIFGGGNASLTLSRCTITGNSSDTAGAISNAITTAAPTPTIDMENCIVWGNGPDPIQEGFGTITATYSNVEGTWPGLGNLDEDPLFVDPDNGDYSLDPDSPSIDAGDPDETDPDGTVRDQGALYFPQAPFFLRGDADSNNVVSPLLDSLALLNWAFNGGVPPACEDAADADDNGTVAALIDSLALLQWGFGDQPPPPAPGPFECNLDPDLDADGIGCETEPNCD